MKYFQNCQTLEEAKRLYFRLAKQHHPDCGGDEATMKVINAEYESVCKILPHEVKQEKGPDGQPQEQTEQTTAEQEAASWGRDAEAFIKAVTVALRCEGVTVEICGTRLWVSGDTRPHKDTLKDAGYMWAAKKKCWYWHSPDEPRKWHKGSTSMSYIRRKYGSKTLKQGTKKEETKRLACPT